MSHMGDPTTMFDMNAIMNLLDAGRKDDDDADSDNEGGGGGAGATMGPGSIGPAKKNGGETKTSVYQKREKNKNDIWEEEEVTSPPEADVVDPREQPEHEIRYRQRVGTEDMFLGTTGKDPTTACCEEINVIIKLPNTKRDEMNLTVETQSVDCRTPRFKLQLHLPHPVDADAGKAKWDVDAETLTITLPIKREYDFINFR